MKHILLALIVCLSAVAQTSPIHGLDARGPAKFDNLLSLASMTYAQVTALGAVANGGTVYCSDCTQATPAASGGAGAFLRRVAGVWVGSDGAGGGGGSSAWAALTAGTNTTGAFVIGSGASLAATGGGTIAATSVTGTFAGDMTGTQGATVNGKLNGTSAPTNATADQLLLTTAPATGAWASLPLCLDSLGQHLNYNTSTHAFSCGTSGGAGGGSGLTGSTVGAIPRVTGANAMAVTATSPTYDASGNISTPGNGQFGIGSGIAGGAELYDTGGTNKVVLQAPPSLSNVALTLRFPAGNPAGQCLQFPAPTAGVSQGVWTACSGGASSPLVVYDATPSTGATSATIRAGAGDAAGAKLFRGVLNDGTTEIWSITRGGLLSTSLIGANEFFVQDALWFGATANFTRVQSAADGNLALTYNSGSGFNLLQLGGTGSAFGGIKRIGNTIAIRRADDTVATVTTLPACSAGTEGGLAGVYDAASTTYGAALGAGGGTSHVLAYCDGTSWSVH